MFRIRNEKLLWEERRCLELRGMDQSPHQIFLWIPSQQYAIFTWCLSSHGMEILAEGTARNWEEVQVLGNMKSNFSEKSRDYHLGVRCPRHTPVELLNGVCQPARISHLGKVERAQLNINTFGEHNISLQWKGNNNMFFENIILMFLMRFLRNHVLRLFFCNYIYKKMGVGETSFRRRRIWHMWHLSSLKEEVES